MKNFIIQICLFTIYPILFFGFNIVVNSIIYSNIDIKMKSSRTLILGDSHPQRALNPILFADAQNISQYAEPYVITFWNVKKNFTKNSS